MTILNVILPILLAIIISTFLKRTEFVTPLMALVTNPLRVWFVGR